MGRVARYKKIKYCDPFAKKSTVARSQRGSKKLRRKDERRRTYEQNATAPRDDFNLGDIRGSLKKEVSPAVLRPEPKVNGIAGERVLPGRPAVAEPDAARPIQATLDEAKLAASLLKVPQKSLRPGGGKAEVAPASVPPPEAPQTKIEGRREGESNAAFRARLRMTTAEILRDDLVAGRRNRTLKASKKDFLNNKKKRGKKRRPLSAPSLDPEIDEEDASSAPIFGESAERPPEFKNLPRGARKGSGSDTKRGSSNAARDSDKQRQKDAMAMEQLRLKAVAQYALVKARRKREGDFHL